MVARVVAVIIVLFCCGALEAQGRVNVRSYTRSDGTHVRAHTRPYPGSGGGGFPGAYAGGFSSGPALGSWNNYGVPVYVPKPIDLEARRTARMQGLVYVRAYQRADGTWVDAHFRTYPDGIESNNLSAQRSSIGSSGAFREANDFVFPSFRRSRLHEQQLASRLVAEGVDASRLGFGYTRYGKIDGYFVDDEFHSFKTNSPPVKWPAPDPSEEDKAQGLLRIAKQFLAQPGKEIAGMQWLQKVLDKYPETAAAGEATDLQARTLERHPWLVQFRKYWQPVEKAA